MTSAEVGNLTDVLMAGFAVTVYALGFIGGYLQ